jgi:membrane dipeptidase
MASYDAAVIVDGHNDLALRLWRGEEPRHVDLARAAEAGFAGGFFALFVPGSPMVEPARAPYDLPLDEPVGRDEARRVANELAEVVGSLDVRIARSVDDFVTGGPVAAVMHLEGAEALAPDLSDLEAWYERGLRSVGIVWSRPNAFGEGVPFRFPGPPDTGPGLTDAGRNLVVACNRLGVLVDVSHLNEAGFWEVAAISDAPLVASHSNAHALCASTRNLTDEQLDAIGRSRGVVGVNFAVGFLRADGQLVSDTPLSEIVRHVDYVAKRIGIDCVAFGSDFEGSTVPEELGGIVGLPRLVEALRSAGYDDEAVAKITHRNWLRVLGTTWRRFGRYFDSAGDDARPTLLAALEGFEAPGLAVDLGAGTGRDTAELLRRGWRVIAIDREREAIERLRDLAGSGSGRLETHVASYTDVRWPVCDLVNASYSLPLCPPAEFERLWRRIVDSLRPGGRFCGQLYGVNDEWAGTGLVVLTRAQVEDLLRELEIERLDEVDDDGQTAIGTRKHWHLFHVVARKR